MHSFAHFSKRLVGNFVRTAIAVSQNVMDVVHLAFQLATALTQRRQVRIHALVHVFLQRARSTFANFFGNFHFRAARAQSSRSQKRRNTRTVFLIERDHALGVGLGLLDELPRFLFGQAQRNSVAVALGHLAAVQAGHFGDIVVQDAFGQREHFGVALVEAARNLARDLDMGQLVLTNRNDVALAEQNVASLMYRVRKQKTRERMTRSFLLRLHRGVAEQLAFGDQTQKRQHELV